MVAFWALIRVDWITFESRDLLPYEDLRGTMCVAEMGGQAVYHTMNAFPRGGQIEVNCGFWI